MQTEMIISHVIRTKANSRPSNVVTVRPIKATPHVRDLTRHLRNRDGSVVCVNEGDLVCPSQMLVARPRYSESARPRILEVW